MSMSGSLVFQQIFHFEVFKFKTSALNVDYSNLVKICEIIPDIDETIKSTVLYKILPSKILENVVETVANDSTIDLEKEYISVLHDEVETNLHRLFKCDACKVDNPSQYKHECMMLSYEELYLCVGDGALMAIDVNRVVSKLKSRNVLHLFTDDFFTKQFDYEIKLSV